MGKSRAEIQRAYRQRKREAEGEIFLDKERKRTRKYYVPISERSKSDQKARREKVRKNVQQFRLRKRLAKLQEEQRTICQRTECMETDENGVSSTTHGTKECEHQSNKTPTVNEPLIVKLPGFQAKQRSRRRVSRALSKKSREMEKLKATNKQLQTKIKTVSKRYERLCKKVAAASTSVSDKPSTSQSEIPKTAPLTPRKRLASNLRDIGVSPRKVPRQIKKSLLLGGVIYDEIQGKRKDNGKKGRQAIANIISGKLLKKYRLQSFLNKHTGISRRSKCRSQRCDTIPKQQRQPVLREIKRQKVKDFLTRDDNSRMMPGKGDKVTDNKKHEQKRVLNDSMGFLHMKFQAETEDKMSFATFCRLRPKSIALTRYITKNQCLCQKHQNMALTLKALRSFGATVPQNPDEFMRKYIQDESMLKDATVDCPEVINHEQWKKVTLDDGKKRTKVVNTERPKAVFMDLLEKQTQEFKQHVYRVKQQYKAMGDLKDNLPEGHVIAQMDFAENFTCSTADAVQSAYWNATTITLHPVVIYYREAAELKHINYVFVSDDLGHNIGSVYAFLKRLIPEVRESLNSELKKVYYWTDGPSSQYRNKTAFYIVSNHEDMLGTAAEWNYFETGHGKGACDGVGGTAKRMADLSIKQGKVTVQDGSDFYKWGCQYHKSARYMLVTQDECANARKEIEDINVRLIAVKGTMQVHHVSPVAKGRVRTMVTSCYCESCLDGRIHTKFEESTVMKEQPNDNNVVEVNEGRQHTEVGGVDTDEFPHEDAENTQGQPRNDPFVSKEWVAAIYENDWHIGQIEETDLEDGDCLVTFMRRDMSRSTSNIAFKWPFPADRVWVSFDNIIQRIAEPTKLGRSGRKYYIANDEIASIENRMRTYNGT